ncbi:transporter substrate-binding domain-containing protein [Shewanella sp. JM162201]|uniref:Transporter substrate-binding domain-containing protein n=1 Tax=Shewanella jiangmenensis TaxID=2837387 RepID=A0ABS5V3H9_9GAMM|nr:transporter substrate-binding domain-containing protein [Shewanella jiangmenensis]MBT1444377.1 transporter substrate-binding domain-containing protein [Shewanella jiangmenensis]
MSYTSKLFRGAALLIPLLCTGTLLFTCTLLFSSTLLAAPLVIPILSDYPIDTELTSQTLNGNVLHALERHSGGQFEFKPQVMPQSRAWKYIEENDACIFNQIKTPERESKASFTKFPVTLYPPIRLIISDGDRRWPTVFDPQAFNLPPNVQIGTVAGHSYGTRLDAAIAAHPQQFFRRTGTESSFRLNDMLVAGRIDAVLNYAVAVQVYLDEHHPGFKFNALPIKGAEQGVEGFIVCSATDAGRDMAALINGVFAQKAMQADFVRFHQQIYQGSEQSWLGSEFRRLKLPEAE